MSRDNSLGSGAYYRQEDYAGFTRRLLVMLIDSLVLLCIAIAFWAALYTAFVGIDSRSDPSPIFLLLMLFITWLYLVPLKRSRFRTVAYRLLKLKIVTTKNERPSLFMMTFRLMMWSFGPFNFLVDIIWLGADTEGQSLRDCYAGTYVVRHDAEPIGFAPVHLTRYTGAGLTLAYPRVCRPKNQEPQVD